MLHNGRWVEAADLARSAAADEKLAEYRRLRLAHGGNAAGELQLARWCRKQGFEEEARLHWIGVLLHDASNMEAIRALGLHKYRGQWLPPEQIAGLKQAEKEFEAARNYWKPRLERWADEASRTSDDGVAALESLRAIDDVAAIPYLEAIVSQKSSELGREVVDIVARLEEPHATASLVRHALLSNFAGVRAAAITQLKKRPIETFVGPLVESLTSPPEVDVSGVAEAAPVSQPTLVRTSLTARIETISEVTQLDTTYRGVSFGGSLAAAAQGGMAERWSLAASLQSLETLNQRICELLDEVTGKDFGRDEKKWWAWWLEHNQRYVDSNKPVRQAELNRTFVSQVELARAVPKGIQGVPRSKPSSQAQPASPAPQSRSVTKVFNGKPVATTGTAWSFSCFTADTPVQTKLGAMPMKDLRAGDLVLSQDPTTGELAYKPVLATTTRPLSPLLLVKAGDTELRTTLGHPFWVVGKGWVMAQHLSHGDRLHGPSGDVSISEIKKTEDDFAFNLVVADFPTYFVGQTPVLVHDNTNTEPIDAAVPGYVVK